jgi:hypothetical protein
MSAKAKLPAKAFDGVPFDDFYDRALPVVYGYLLRLCGGDRDEAWDLTQDSNGDCSASCDWCGPAPATPNPQSWRPARCSTIYRSAPQEHRVVLMLAYVDDLPIAEIAQLLGSSTSSTYSLLTRARNELRSHLTGPSLARATAERRAQPPAGRAWATLPERHQVEADDVPVDVGEGHALVPLDFDVHRLVAIIHRPSLPHRPRGDRRALRPTAGVPGRADWFAGAVIIGHALQGPGSGGARAVSRTSISAWRVRSHSRRAIRTRRHIVR